jgi:hypothetical protein
MAKNSAINLDVSPLADGFSLAGGTVSREARFDGANTRFIGQTTAALTLPNAATTNLVGENYVTAKGDILAATASNALSRVAVGTNGQFLQADSGAANGVSWASVGGTWTWTEVTGTSAALVALGAVIANNAALVTLTLPATAAVGDQFWVVGKGAGLFRIAQNASQLIHIGSSASTAGVGGYVEATNRYDAVRLVCTVANTEFTASMAPQGNITIV